MGTRNITASSSLHERISGISVYTKLQHSKMLVGNEERYVIMCIVAEQQRTMA
jgi:hypothetical protein